MHECISTRVIIIHKSYYRNSIELNCCTPALFIEKNIIEFYFFNLYIGFLFSHIKTRKVHNMYDPAK